MSDEQQEEQRFKRIQETFGDDPDMLTAALAASEELLARYKTQIDRYKQIAVTAAHKFNVATEKSRKRAERIANLRQDVADRVAAHYEEFKQRVGASTALGRAEEELKEAQERLAAKEAECAEWQARFQDLHTRIETLRSAMSGLYPEMVPGSSGQSKTSLDEAARQLGPPLAAVLRIINVRPPAPPTQGTAATNAADDAAANKPKETGKPDAA